MILYIVAGKSYLDINKSRLIFYLRSYLYNLPEFTRPSLRNLTQGFDVRAISSLSLQLLRNLGESAYTILLTA